EVELAVRQPLALQDATEAGDRFQLRRSRRVAHVRLADLRNGHEPVRRQRMFGHLPVARLEDVQGQHRVGEKHDPGKEERTGDGPEVAESEFAAHRSAWPDVRRMPAVPGWGDPDFPNRPGEAILASGASGSHTCVCVSFDEVSVWVWGAIPATLAL